MILSVTYTVFIMLIYMMIGFFLCKGKKAVVSHGKSVSAMLIYILAPAMILNSFLQLECTGEILIKLLKCFGVTLFTQLSFMGILFLVLHKKYDNAAYRILTVGGVLGNVGFLGMPLVQSVFPNDPIVMCYSSINVMTMNLIVFTIGTFLITNDKKYISIKSAILNPTVIAMAGSLLLFIFKVRFPANIESSIALLAKMVTPLCMFVLGMRLSEAKIKDLFTRPFVYATCALKLVAFPLFTFLIVKWLPFMDDVFKGTVIVLSCVPAGAVIESLAEFHDCDQEFAANVVLLTTLLSVITIPLMTMLLV